MDLGEIHWLLGIELKRDYKVDKLMLSQQLYISTLLHWFGLENTKPVNTPIDSTLWLISDQSPKSMVDITCMTNILYQETVGILIYATFGICLNIAYLYMLLLEYA